MELLLTILLLLILGLLLLLLKKLAELAAKVDKISQILNAIKDAGAIRPRADDGTPPKDEPEKPK